MARSKSADALFCAQRWLSAKQSFSPSPPGKDREQAQENRDDVADQMSAPQVAEAQRQVREWKPKIPARPRSWKPRYFAREWTPETARPPDEHR